MSATDIGHALLTRCYRIGDPVGRYPIFSGEGAARVEGRWHERGQEVIYASEHYATAMLEKLVHYNGLLPPKQYFIEIDIPEDVSIEAIAKEALPGWDRPDGSIARSVGARWLREKRTAVLVVPSYVVREERNVLINPAHRDFRLIRPGKEKPVWWDDRLF